MRLHKASDEELNENEVARRSSMKLFFNIALSFVEIREWIAEADLNSSGTENWAGTGMAPLRA
jgi:hypothetical protein